MNMPRYQVQASNYNVCSMYIADGFPDDCDELIHRCSQVNTLSYEKFCNVWKEMDFACVFHGRSLASELAELSEEVLHIAKNYMVANTDNYEESVAGLFLVYGLLNLQPISKFAHLRLIPEDVPAIARIQSVARQTRRLDVLYILGSVLISNTHYHAVQRERGMEYPIRKYLEGYTTIDKQSIRPKGVFYRQNEELDIIRELSRLEKTYKGAKEALIGPGKSERNLNYVNDNLASELDASLKNVISAMTDTDNKNPENASSEAESSTLHSIKDKAMKMPVKGMGHLIGVNNRIPQGRKPKPKKSPRKRKGQAKRGPRKKRRRKSKDSETTSDEDELNLSDDDDDELDDIDEIEAIQSRLESKDVCEIEIIDEYKDKDKNPLMSMLVEQMKLPDLDETVESGSNDLIEIKDALQKRDVILTEVGTSSRCESSGSTVTDVAQVITVNQDDDTVFKEPNKLIGTKQRRDLKKYKIKTKFQRMGMLPVANFQENNHSQNK